MLANHINIGIRAVHNYGEKETPAKHTNFTNHIEIWYLFVTAVFFQILYLPITIKWSQIGLI